MTHLVYDTCRMATKVDTASFRRQYSRKYEHDERCTTDVLRLCDAYDALRAVLERIESLGWAGNVTDADARIAVQAAKEALDGTCTKRDHFWAEQHCDRCHHGTFYGHSHGPVA